MQDKVVSNQTPKPLKMINETAGPNEAAKNTPWYNEGLRFECTQCGQCCTGAPGYTWVTDDEILTIAKQLGISVKECCDRYVRKVGDRRALLEKHPSFDCIFLKDNRCQVYQARPKQCRTFPWWKSNLQSREEWLQASTRCEGINQGPIIPIEVIREHTWEN